MAYFPLIQGTASGGTSAGTSHAITMPSSIVAGETLMVFFGCSASNTTDTPSGWAKFFDETGDDHRLTIYTKTAAGSDTLTVTTSGSTTAGNATYRVQTNNSFQSAFAVSTSPNFTPNPPNLAPTGGSEKYTWIAVGVGRQTPTAFPANYSSNQLNAGVDLNTVFVASRNLEGSSENPGAFVLGSTTAGEWIAVTVAIEERTPFVASFPIVTSAGTIFAPAINYAAQVTTALLTSASSIIAPITQVTKRTNWVNDTKPSTTWTNEQR